MELSSPTAVYLVEMAQLFHTTTDDILGLESEEKISLRGMNEQEKRLVYDLVDYISGHHKPSPRPGRTHRCAPTSANNKNRPFRFDPEGAVSAIQFAVKLLADYSSAKYLMVRTI